MPIRGRWDPMLVPALAAVAVLVYWAAHEGGYPATTWQPSALAILGLAAATAGGLGLRRMRPSRPMAVALGAFAAYVAWSYLSILWAAAPGDALEGSNRALLFLLLFGLFALVPWRTGTAKAVMALLALGVGTIAVVTLVRLGVAAQVAVLIVNGRLRTPTGYDNGAAALLFTGSLLAVGLAARRELPAPLRALLVAMATAELQLTVLCASRGWLFSLPLVAAAAFALVPGRVRLLVWALIPAVGTLAALPALLDVFRRWDPMRPLQSRAPITEAAGHVADLALPICAAALLAGLALAVIDRRTTVRARTMRVANRLTVVVVTLGVLTGVAVGIAATDGRPDRAIADYWNRSGTYQSLAAGASRFGAVGSNRPDFWRVSLDAVRAHPLEGLGQDNWGNYYLKHRRSPEQPRWTHSIELRLLAHTGIVGFVLFAAFLVAALWAVLRRPWRGLADRGLATVALLPLVVWLIHGSVDWFWEIPALSGPALALLGLACSLARRPAPVPARERRATGWSRALVGAAAAGVTLVAAAALTFPYLADREVATASQAWVDDPQGAFRALHRAARLDRLSAEAPLTEGVIALHLGRHDRALASLDEAIGRDASNWFAYFARGLAASAAGRRDLARRSFAQARVLDPDEPLVRLALERVGTSAPLTLAQTIGYVRQGQDALGLGP